MKHEHVFDGHMITNKNGFFESYETCKCGAERKPLIAYGEVDGHIVYEPDNVESRVNMWRNAVAWLKKF